jgi:ABC-2 type transport system ATP-binding protein
VNSVIKVNRASKLYGATVGVEDISFEVPKGTVFGFLGPNGAGKSTTINMLVDFIRPTSGNIKIFGLDSIRDSLEIRRRIGFLAGDFALDKGLTGWQQLSYFGALRGNYDKKYVNELATRLECKLDRKFKTLSRGNKQKIGLIAALMHKPELLVFDEPTSGLDPLIQAEFNKIIVEQKQRGATTFISSHVLSEVQEICDHVAFIRQGRIITSQPLKDIINAAARRIKITGTSKSAASELIVNLKLKQYDLKGDMLAFDYRGDMNDLVKVLSRTKLKDITINATDLESIFMGYYGEHDA